VEIKELLNKLLDIVFDLCPQCSLSDEEHEVVDEIIEKLQVYDKLKENRGK